jgi:hypothetical protein
MRVRVICFFCALHLPCYHGVKKFPGFFRRNMVPLVPHRDFYAGLMALFHTETGLKADLLVEILFLDHLLKRLDHIIGPFDMAGTSDTNA